MGTYCYTGNNYTYCYTGNSMQIRAVRKKEAILFPVSKLRAEAKEGTLTSAL